MSSSVIKWIVANMHFTQFNKTFSVKYNSTPKAHANNTEQKMWGTLLINNLRPDKNIHDWAQEKEIYQTI